MMTNQRQVRRAFWQEHPSLPHKRTVSMGRYKVYPTDTRVAFCDYVEWLSRDGLISEKLASRVTL